MVVHSPADTPSRAAARFVGRARELAELRAGLRDAMVGRSGLFLIVGDPGIGKTRLADHIAIEAAAAGAHTLRGASGNDRNGPALRPWSQVVAALRQLDPTDELDPLVANLAYGATAVTADNERFPLFDAVTRCLVRAAGRRPLLIVLDDLHAADPPSLALLEFFARTLRESHVLVLCTARTDAPTHDEEHAMLLGHIARFGHRLPLSGLSRDEVACLLAEAYALPDRLAGAVHEITEGNPRFVEEVARALMAEPGNHPPEAPTAADLPIPDALRETVRARLRPLSAACVPVLRVAAVIGREFELPLLAMVQDLASNQLTDLLGEAARAGVVTASGWARYAFTHPLVRHTLSHDVPAPQREEILRRIGAATQCARSGHHPTPRSSPHFLRGADEGALARSRQHVLDSQPAARHTDSAMSPVRTAGGPAQPRPQLATLRAAPPRAGASARVAHAHNRMARGPIVLRREADYWTLSDALTETRIKHTKGLHYLAQLLRHPGRELHVVELAATHSEPAPPPHASPISAAHLAAAGVRRTAPGDLGEVVDARAQAAYRARLKALRKQLHTAGHRGEQDRAARLHHEIDALTAELTRAVGLWGQRRVIAPHLERIRLNVSRAIRTAIERIGRSHAAVAQHLRAAVRTGTFCCYLPEPLHPVDWRLD